MDELNATERAAASALFRDIEINSRIGQQRARSPRNFEKQQARALLQNIINNTVKLQQLLQ